MYMLFKTIIWSKKNRKKSIISGLKYTSETECNLQIKNAEKSKLLFAFEAPKLQQSVTYGSKYADKRKIIIYIRSPKTAALIKCYEFFSLYK